jgi:hypothetical protein
VDAIEIAGSEVMATIARNLAADENAAHALIYWSPVVEAPVAVFEIEIPAGANPAKVRIAAPEISHLFASARHDWALPKAAGTGNRRRATWQRGAPRAMPWRCCTPIPAAPTCAGTLLPTRHRRRSFPIS